MQWACMRITKFSIQVYMNVFGFEKTPLYSGVHKPCILCLNYATLKTMYSCDYMQGASGIPRSIFTFMALMHHQIGNLL